ncbi:25478_t:CDS:1, partial [Gigaspora margarita]
YGFVNEDPKIIIYRELINLLKIEESEHQVINLSKIKELKPQLKNLLKIKKSKHQVNNSFETKESSLLKIVEFNHNSFINFLEEIKENYKNWDP